MQSDCARIAKAADIGGHPPILAIGERLLLVRTVVLENQPSQVQVIAYQIRDGVLQRVESPVTRDLVALDAFWNKFAQDGMQEQAVALQADVTSMRLRIWLVGAGNWIGTAPGEASGMLQGGAPVTVKGLEVTLQLRGSEQFLTKVLLLGPV
jgi:general secretion pathway protein J